MSKFSVKKPMTVVVSVVLVLLLGVVSFTKMKTDLLPSIDLPYAIVITTYPGASPEEVENTISKPIEQSMATISNIKNISSVSSENYSMVILEFSDKANMDSVTIDIRESLDILEGSWTSDMIGTPTVMKLNPEMMPVMVAAIDVDEMDDVEISNYVSKELLAKVESVDGVASATTSGIVEEEIHVLISQEKIDEINQAIQAIMTAHYMATATEITAPLATEGADPLEEADLSDPLETQSELVLPSINIGESITAEMITGILAAQNFSMPAGYITEDNVDYLVRVGDKLDSIETMQNLVLFDLGIPGVEAITLSDVADVFKVNNSQDNYAKVNGNDAIVLSIQKQNGYSTAEVSDSLKERFTSLTAKDGSLHVSYLMDQGMYIELIVNSVLNNLLYGAILAIIILLFFLKDIKPTAVIACSIPISVIFAVVLMYFSGVTLNMISLSGLAIGVGMLVDNSIVVIENIYRLRNKGVPPLKAAVEGAKQVSGAIVASTLTTICVFVPIVFVEGITRQLFVDMALTIGYSLIASLIVALTVVPAMSSRLLKEVKEKKHPIMDGVGKVYEKTIRWSLRFKPVVLLLAIVILGASIFAAISNGTAFMPDMDSTQISVTVIPPKEATMEDQVAYLDEVMERIMTISDVETVGGMISNGTENMSFMSSGSGLSVYVLLDEKKTESSEEAAKQITELCSDMECEVIASGSSFDMTALGGSGITLLIQGEEIEKLQIAASEVATILEGVKGTTEVSDGMENPAEELQIVVDKEKAILKGLTVAQVFGAIAEDLGSASTATTLRYEGVDYPVVVLTEENQTELTTQDIKDYQFTSVNPEGVETNVKLSEIATISDGVGLTNISRENGNRYIKVTAAIEDGYNIGLVSNDVDKVLEDYELPDGYTIVSSGEDDTINDALKDMGLMLFLAVVFIYLIMVAQFQSLKSPFIVMFTILLAFTGGFLGLWLTGNEVSVIAMLGFVMLAGIIVNNGIVLVDYINHLRKDGRNKKDALVEAGKTRMRPIFMTAITTVLGLSTMALGVGMGADMVQPIAIVTIGGLLYATITTLYVIPVLYDLFNRKEIKFVSDEDLKVYEEL